MTKFLIDENLPYRISLWNKSNFIHVFDIKRGIEDADIWEYAKQNELVIITKDADFSNKVLSSSAPPKVIHIQVGNLPLKKLRDFLIRIWPDVEQEIAESKLINVYIDHIESIGH